MQTRCEMSLVLTPAVRVRPAVALERLHWKVADCWGVCFARAGVRMGSGIIGIFKHSGIAYQSMYNLQLQSSRARINAARTTVTKAVNLTAHSPSPSTKLMLKACAGNNQAKKLNVVPVSLP